MKIHSDFQGGNIIVKGLEENIAYLSQDMRDSDGYWFYWAFCVEGANGNSVKFCFDNKVIGYYGPAVSYDLINWEWLGKSDSESSFEYTFKEDEDRVYFAHNMLYTPMSLSLLCDGLGLKVKELCKSRNGRSVPCIHLGCGSKKIVFTSRHHACESTGSYVLEGAIRELIEKGFCEDFEFFIVPFVDYDGVVKGDQGKNRVPHDHNRDYGESMIYSETKAIYDFVSKNGIYVGVDFHSPYHKGGINDEIFFVKNNPEKDREFDILGNIFEEECSLDTMDYHTSNNFPANADWNSDAHPSFGNTFNKRTDCRLAFSLETAYFGKEYSKVSRERLVNTGRAFVRALKKYINSESDTKN